jgi:hypothetical protein
MIVLEQRIRGWIAKKVKENSRLEFKLRVALDTAGAKAEFIRDMIALANSEGEFPRADGYLVIGCKNGKHYDVASEHYDGATFGQILDSYVHPPISTEYVEFGRATRVGVLLIKADANALHIVSKKLADEAGKPLLLPGQSWGRIADRKTDLDGAAISFRHSAIQERSVADATAPLRARIEKLENDAGPALEVKRIRFEIQATHDWSAVDELLAKLRPYAREFDHNVKNEVIDAVMEVTSRAHCGMPVWVARSVDTLLSEMIPSVAGGMQYACRSEIPKEDRDLLKRAEYANFQVTWDACRYLRDLAVVEVGAQRYWSLIRFTTLNRIQPLQLEFLKDARCCVKICEEMHKGKAFPEAQRKLEQQIEDALDIPTHKTTLRKAGSLLARKSKRRGRSSTGG